MIHQLKCDSKFFEDVASGKKTFEVRKNDRDFFVGDFLALNELTPHVGNCKDCNAPFGCDACPDEGYNEIDEFAELWDSTIKKSDLTCYGWNASPWVWVIEFERCKKTGAEP